MAITHIETLRNTFANAVTADVDGGGGAGKLVLKTGGTPVATMVLNPTSFGASAAGVIVLDVIPPPQDTNAAGGATVDTFEFQDNASTLVFAGAVPGDLTLSKPAIDAGDVVEVTSFSYTAAP